MVITTMIAKADSKLSYMKGGEKNGIRKACNLGAKYCTDGRVSSK